MEQDKIWDVYQNDPELRAMAFQDGGRINFIVKAIPVHTKALNIGVGRGSLEKLLLDKGVDVHCLDPSETSINRLRDELGLGNKARVGYSQEIPFPAEYFDYVIMTEVLEHLNDWVLQETLREIWRVLKKGGTFMGTVPAEENLMQSIIICPECGNRFHRWGHVQSFSGPRLEAFLSGAFANVKINRVFFADWGTLNWKGKLEAIAKKIQAKAGMKGRNQSFLFTARKV